MHRTVIALFLVALVLAGCGNSTGASSPIRRPAGTLQWAVVGISDVPTLDPALASDPTSISLDSLVYGGLVRLDGRLHVQPDGAKYWKVSRGGTVYTFHLRPRLRYADGHAVTATDFVKALQRALGAQGAAGAASFYLADIARFGPAGSPAVSAPNPLTVRITLRHPAARFLTELAFPTSFVPDPTLPRQYGLNWTDHAAGFGPYRVVTWSHTRSLVLERNRYYWGGTPAFRRIIIHLEGQRAAFAAYRAGTLDVLSGLPPGQRPLSRPQGLRSIPGLALDYLAFNTAVEPFRRVNARRAFAAVWRPSIATANLPDTTFAARGFLPSAFGVSTPGWSATRSPSGYLAHAHYSSAHVFPTVVFAVPRASGLLPLARELARRWQNQLGVLVELRALDPSTYDHTLTIKDFNVALVRWGADYPDPQDFLGTQLGSAAENITGWSTHDYNQAVSLAAGFSPNDRRRDALFRRASALAVRKVPLLPLDEPAVSAVIRPDLHGLTLTPLGTLNGDWVHLHVSGR